MYKQFLMAVALISIWLGPGAARADNVEELIDLFLIREDVEAQHRECLQGSSDSIAAELEDERESGELDIGPGDEDWNLLVAIYAEYYTALCAYLSGDEILHFYRAEFRKRFSPEEIDALIAFHTTPLGRKLNRQWFEISRVFGDVIYERQLLDSTEALKQFEQRLQDFWDYRDDKANSGSREQDA